MNFNTCSLIVQLNDGGYSYTLKISALLRTARAAESRDSAARVRFRYVTRVRRDEMTDSQ